MNRLFQYGPKFVHVVITNPCRAKLVLTGAWETHIPLEGMRSMTFQGNTPLSEIGQIERICKARSLSGEDKYSILYALYFKGRSTSWS